MGSGNQDYRNQITTALQQANQPKSALSQDFSNSMQGMYLPAISNMLNAGMMNAFPGMMNSQGTPGSVFNQQPQPVHQLPISQGPYQPTPTPTPVGGPPHTFPVPGQNTSQSQASMNFSPNGQSSLYATGGQNGQPSIPNYNGGSQYAYQGMFPGIDISKLPPGTNLGQLISSGQITQDQANSAFGFGQGFNPQTDPRLQSQYQQYANGLQGNPNVQQGTVPDYNTWLNTAGPLGTQMNAQSPTDPNQFQSWMQGFPSYNQQIANQPGMTQDQSQQGMTPDKGISSQQYQQLQSQFPGLFSGNNAQYSAQTNGNPSGVQGIPSMGQSSMFPQISQANPQLAGMNMQGMNPQMVQQLSQQFQMPGVNGYNPSSQLLGQSNGINGLGNQLQSQINNATGSLGSGYAQGNLNTNNAQQAGTNFSSTLNPQDSQYYQGVQSLLNQQLTAGRDDIRARFGASGGNSRGTAASYAEGQYNAAALPQLASALGQVRQSEVGNQLQAANLGLQGQLGNAQNQLTAQNQGNSAMLQNQGLANNFQLGQQGNQSQNLGTLGNLFSNQSGLQAQLANQAGNLNLGQQQLGSQNMLGAQGLNSQNALGLLQNQLGFQTNQNQAQLGMNNLNMNNSQFNAGQNNQYTQQYMAMLQAANQQQIQNYLSGYQNIFGTAAGLAGAGIPGGSANVNLGGQSQSWLSQLGGLL